MKIQVFFNLERNLRLNAFLLLPLNEVLNNAQQQAFLIALLSELYQGELFLL